MDCEPAARCEKGRYRDSDVIAVPGKIIDREVAHFSIYKPAGIRGCLLYTSDAADE